MRRSAVLAFAALAVAACSAGEEANDVPMSEAVGHTGGVSLPSTDELPDTDFTSHIVPLEDVRFDTFDGGSLPLSMANPEEIERLRDWIPPIEAPVYVTADEEELRPDDQVLGYVTDSGRAYAFPTRILNFHEIINDDLDGLPVLITYCPLCRSGVVFDRRVADRVLTFGNTSALYDNDMVMYDHQTNSYWWHIAGRAIVGELSGTEMGPLPSSMTVWEDWLERHPNTLVLSTDTGFERPYGRDPFTGYRDLVNMERRPFPDAEASRYDHRLDDGEEVLGVVLDGVARAYPLRQLGDAVVNDELGGTPLVMMSRLRGPTGVVFDRRLDGETLSFVLDDGKVVDEETASTWGLDGSAVDGPLAGRQLTPVPARSSFWFAFVAAYPDTDVYEEG